MLRPVKQRADSVIGLPGADQDAHQGQKRLEPLELVRRPVHGAPGLRPAGERHGDNGYREFMNREFYASSRSLFDAAEGLYYRDARYFGKREKNGKKVFWGRGNGWCYAALAILLETPSRERPDVRLLPADVPPHVESRRRLSGRRGSWHPSMLDHETYPMPENSASGFFTYGLAWGVNRGLLTAPVYKRAARRGWKASVRMSARTDASDTCSPSADRPSGRTAK